MSEKDIHGNNYNAHPETARNKWFNYSDAYIDKDGENQPVADYQEQFAQSVNNARDGNSLETIRPTFDGCYRARHSAFVVLGGGGKQINFSEPVFARI